MKLSKESPVIFLTWSCSIKTWHHHADRGGNWKEYWLLSSARLPKCVKMPGILQPRDKIIFGWKMSSAQLQSDFLLVFYHSSSESIDIAQEQTWHTQANFLNDSFGDVNPVPWESFLGRLTGLIFRGFSTWPLLMRFFVPLNVTKREFLFRDAGLWFVL